MNAEPLYTGHHANALVELHDRVSLDGRHGTALGFYAREPRTVLVRLDAAGLIEVAESRLVIDVGARPGCRPPLA